VYKAPLLSADNLLSGSLTHPTFRVEYENNEQFIRLAMKVGIMADLKNFVPRMAYRGVVSFMYQSHRVYLSRPRDRTEYYGDNPKIRVF
jgi:hypothetical protein